MWLKRKPINNRLWTFITLLFFSQLLLAQSEKKDEIIAIYVMSSRGFDQGLSERINIVFEREFLKKNFRILDRTIAEKTLGKQGIKFNSIDVCETKECRVQIGEALEVDKFVTIDISSYMAKSARILQCDMRITSISEIIIETSDSYKEGIRSGISAEEAEPIIESHVKNWTRKFYEKITPRLVSFALDSSISNVTKFYVNKLYKGELPIKNYELDSYGKYHFMFKASGYETEHRYDTITPSQSTVNDSSITLKKKDKTKAIRQSAFWPGLGQLYSADDSYPGRKTIGGIFVIAGTAAMGASLVSWNNYFQSYREYNLAYDDYMQSKHLEEIESLRDKASSKNEQMINAKSVSIVCSALYGAIWLTSIMEVGTNYPDYYSDGNNLDLKLVHNNGRVEPKLVYKIEF